MSSNGAPASTAAPLFENFSFTFAKPSLLSRLNMRAQVVEPESSPSTGSTSATTDSLTSEPTVSGINLSSDTQSSTAQPDHDMLLEDENMIVLQDTNPSRNGPDRDSSTPRAGSPVAMEIDTNGDPEVVEVPSHSTCGPRTLATYRDLPANHYFVAPPAALPYPRSPVRRFSEGHTLYTQPSVFGHLPRAPPRSPRLDPLEILELESARERNEWEQVCNDLGRPRLERPHTTAGPSVTPSVPQIQTQVNGNTNKAASRAPPSENGYDSDSSDVELRIYNAEPIDEGQSPTQPDSASGTVPPTPLGARPPVAQSLTVPNGAGSAAHRAIIERLSHGPSTPRPSDRTPEAAADRQRTSPQPSNTTPAKRKIDDIDQATQESSAKRKSPTPQQQPTSERTGVPPPLRAEVDRTPAPTPSSTVLQAPTAAKATLQATTAQPSAIPSSSTHAAPIAKSGNICRFHNRPPGRVCVRKDQCPDLHIGELQKPTPGTSPAPTPVIEPSNPSTSAPATALAPVVAPPLSRTPSLANAPPLGTNPSPPSRPVREPCRFFTKPGGCARGVLCQYAHVLNNQISRPPSRQLAPSPIPPIPAPSPSLAPKAPPAPIPIQTRPKAPLPVTAAPSNQVPISVAPLAPTFTPAAPFAPAPVPSIPTPQPTRGIQTHPLPAKPSPATSPKAGTSQAKGKKGKGKAAQGVQGTLATAANAVKPGVPSNANQPGGSANVQVKIEPDAPVLNTKTTKRKTSASQPKPQPTRLNTGAREIKQEEVTLYDLADDSPQEPSGSSVLPPELMQSQPRTEVPQAQAQPRPIAPLPTRAGSSAARTAVSTATSTVLPPLKRPPPPPYRPPPSSNQSSSPSSQVSPAPVLMPAAPPASAVPPAPSVPTTTVIPPTPARPVPEPSAAKVANAPATNTANSPAAIVPKSPTANGAATQATGAPNPPAAAGKLTISVPPRPNPSPAPPRPDMAPDSSPPQVQAQLRPRSREASREPARPESQALTRRMNPRRDSREPPRRTSPERRSLMTRLDHRSNPNGRLYRSPSRSRSPGRHYSPHRRRSPPSRGRSPSPVRYRDWRSRSRSPARRPLKERFAPRGIPPRRSRSPSWSTRYSRSPSRSPMYRHLRSISRSRSRSPRRQRIEASPPVDGYTNGSAYFPTEKHIPRAWEPEAGVSRPVQNEGYDSSPSETMVIVDRPNRSSTPPPRTAITALNDYDSFNQSRTMDISPMSSPSRGYTGSGLGNRISNYPPPTANDYPSMANTYAISLPEQRENLLNRMTGEPDLANRLAPAGSPRRQAPNRAQQANKSTQPQQPLANRLGGGDSYPSQVSRNDRRPPPRDTAVRGGKLMSRMMGQ